MSKTLDLVTKLLLDNQDFDRNLKMSTQQVKAFQTVGNSVLSTLGKFAGAIGIAGGTMATFDKIMHSSEVTSDAFDSTMRECTTTVGAFFKSLATGDFSAFDEGLVGLINRAKEAYDALDQLENTLLSFDRKSSQNQSEFDTLYADAQELKIKIKNAKTQKEKDDLQKQFNGVVADMQKIRDDQAGRVGTVTKDTEDAIKKLIREKNPLIDEKDLTRDVYRDIMDIASDKNRDKRKSEAAKYNEIIDKKRREFEAKHTITTTQYDNTMGTLSEVKFTDYDKVNKDLKQWINSRKKSKEYKDAILTTILYDKETTDKLKEITELDLQQSAAERTVSAMDRKLNRLNASTTTTSTTVTPKHTPTPLKDDPYKNIAADMDTVVGTQKMINELQEEQKTANVDDLAILGQKIKFLRTYLSLMQNGDIDKESQLILKEQYEKGDFEDEYEEVVEEVKIDPNSLEALQEQKSELIKKLNTSTNHDDYVKILAEISVVDEKMTDITEDKSGNERNKNLTKQAKLYNNLSRTIRGVGAAMQATGNQSKAMARSLAMVNAAASIAMMIAIMVEKLKTTKSPWEFIAAGLAGTAAVVSMAAQLRSINTAKYAEGGIVQSNNTIGDRNFVRVNGGEMILNNRQQRNLFTLLNGNVNGASNNTANVEFHISGRELVGVIDNYNNKMKRVK